MTQKDEQALNRLLEVIRHPIAAHPKNHDCKECAELRAEAKIGQWRLYGGLGELDPAKTVFVRAHWRVNRESPAKINYYTVLKSKLSALRR